MTAAEKRKFLRLNNLHLLDYLLVDEQGNQNDYCMARTLDVSTHGIKMETIRPIPQGSTLIITLGLEDNLVDISGHCIHTQSSVNRYISGVAFDIVSTADQEVLCSYVKEFMARRESLLQRNDYPPVETDTL